MKKKIALFLSMIMIMALFGGCAEKESENVHEMAVENYVTLGEYKGLEVSVDDVPVDEDEATDMAYRIYWSNITKENGGITDRPVELFDEVNIDYVGYVDGVAFEGGSTDGQGAMLGIGMNEYIEGFEIGLLDVMPGETVDLNLTFPEDYGIEDLNGKDVLFNVTVNYIYPYEFDDALIASWGIEEYSNEAELREYVTSALKEVAQLTIDSDVENAVINLFMDNCTFKEVPENLIQKYSENIQSNIETTAATYNLSGDNYCLYFYGTDMATLVETFALETSKQALASQAVANAEGITVTDEELDAELNALKEANGLESVEELLGTMTREYYREYMLVQKVSGFLADNANVTLIPVTTEE